MPYKQKWKNPSGTKAYFAWRSMRQRCCNPDHPAFKNYGGRGIGVCAEWLDDYDKFFADMGQPGPGMTLERIDVNLPYSKSNCAWATWTDQGRNKRSNRKIDRDGKTQTCSAWAEELKIGADTLHRRLKKMPIERALTEGSLRRVPDATHGSRSMYEGGCRCEECRATHNLRMREQRARRNLAQTRANIQNENLSFEEHMRTRRAAGVIVHADGEASDV